ncbi:MAG TPA: bifunctional DNA-formamidopyrimidine glycosylase/DNA-(apurinic or apyrimidinic site) lyase [Candidatus Acidoferrales bacterium]|nr:bifunctional DNA-formamidopyrimidine glycosylase/DNA-(apurinic or apyrimidinic site) lyase [Candidatus Acidoferrales bacterium]
MPELPEVETVVRGLQMLLPGRGITEVRLGKTDFIDDPVALEENAPGCKIASVRRHGKFLVLELEKDGSAKAEKRTGAKRFNLIVHLGMTGQLTVRPETMPAAAHTHVWFALDNRTELRYTDARRFGRMVLSNEEGSKKILGPLGIDALTVSEKDFRARIGARRARIKALLLDQSVLRGMGNIYTDESLWRARIHPTRIGAELNREEMIRLRGAMQRVLRAAVRLGGSSISDYVNAEGEPGEFQLRHNVYQREGKKCARCGTMIRRIIVAGRSSYFCSKCQRAPRGRPRKIFRGKSAP